MLSSVNAFAGQREPSTRLSHRLNPPNTGIVAIAPKRMRLLPALLILCSFAFMACAAQPQFKGRAFAYGAAPNFQLLDQDGQSISLAEQRGKVVVLAFMYTHCRDICPVTAAELSETYQQLGDAAKRASFIVISTDPENDNVETAQQFTRTAGLEGKWHYLMGARAQLEAVWKAYYVPAQKTQSTPDASGTVREDVIHFTSILLIDPQGQFRLIHDNDFDPADLAHDIRALLDEQKIF